MADKMLIDASHKEETRVVVTRGNRIEEFDFESEHKKQLKGNIYLARVTRVEPSLQAAFVEYGGNRHGFLAFSEIHPDYYQIPIADRQALVELEAHAALQAEAREVQEGEQRHKEKRRGKKTSAVELNRDLIKADREGEEDDALLGGEGTSEIIADDNDEHGEEGDPQETIETVGAEDALEEVDHYQYDYRRDYKIQEVIKRRQILLVQVVKEERGNKGAALTTYLSLAGRYSVLMPNTARGGGISRKITNVGDRKRLKEVVADLEVPKGMGIILRTAGANRTKAEIRRDYEYLMRLWENVRNLTLSSIAPALVYEEGSLIKRSIRDLYNKDIGEVLVAGEEGYREAKDFMRMLMPSHAKVVQPYRDSVPIFARNGIETQLDRMLQPEVSLKSGGYLVINQTEALVAIDVNSGRSTKEHSVEDTALQTNLEAAEEVARQLRLRDLAGLVVIDFIDMDERRHIRAVERRLKDCLKEDRARIQVGHISHFGLLEMSRQRLRASVLESTTQICPHCNGTGYVRSQSSLALHVMRTIEDYLLRNKGHNIIVRTLTETALYVLNHKRQMLSDFEARFGLSISIEADSSVGTQHLLIDKGEMVTPALSSPTSPTLFEPPAPMVEEVEEESDLLFEAEISVSSPAHQEDNGRRRKNKKRGRDRETSLKQMDSSPVAESPEQERVSDLTFENGERDKKRRRQRRSGRRGRDMQGRVRLPWPEPVGQFAASAQATARHLRRVRYAPHAEPVGDFFTHAPQEIVMEIAVKEDVILKNTTSTDSAEVIDIIVDEISIAAPQPEATLSATDDQPRRKRRTSRQQAEKNIAPINAENLKHPTQPLQEGAVVVALEVNEEAAPKKRRTRSKKNDLLQATAEEEAAVAKPPKAPRKRRATKNKAEEVAADQLVAPVDREEKIEKQNEAQPAIQPLQENDILPEPSEDKVADSLENVVSVEAIVVSSSLPETEKPKRKGWWQRRGFL